MNDTEFERRIRDAVRGRGEPQSTEAQMEAILARRNRGERVRLPTDLGVGGRPHMLRWAIIVAAAAAASVIAVSRGRISPPRQEPTTSAARPGPLGPDALYAQVTDRPTFPIIRAIRPLKPGVWRYGWADEPSAPVDSLDQWRQERSTDTYEGAVAYRYRYGKRMATGEIVLTDTLWLNHESLRPLARVAGMLTGGHVTEIYKENSIVTGHTTPGGMTSWRSMEFDSLGFWIRGQGRIPAGLSEIPGPISAWRPQVAAALEAADLRADWRGSMEALVAAGGYMAERFWLNFYVVGEERITVPAGTFDAWRIQVGEPQPRIQVGKSRQLFAWVSKEQQWLLRLGLDSGAAWHGQQLLLSGEMTGER